MHKRFASLFLAFLLLPFSYAMAGGTIAVSVSSHAIKAGDTVTIYFDVQQEGLVHVAALDSDGVERAVIADAFEAEAGLNQILWNGTEFGNPLPGGEYTIVITSGERSVEVRVSIESDAASFAGEAPGASAAVQKIEATEEPLAIVAAGAQADSARLYPAPNARSSYIPDHDPDGCYFCTPMNIEDEAAVWAMLTSPVTVVDVGQKEQVVLRAEPSDDSEGVGVVTGESQSVHVLKDNGDGWTLIECYSSSFHDSKVKAWNAYVSGYIRTNQLKKLTPKTEYGIVIDKLTQRLYLFKEGKLFTTLLVSTGLYNSKQPYNETRSGEFVLVSKVGDFRSDALICGMGMRFNSGDLLHEVPHVKNADGTKNYRNCEPKLGMRASHGCIRTQRLKNQDGINMTWIWNNVPLKTKMVVWEDYQGRQIPIPDGATPVYYNPNGGSSYHAVADCPGVRDKFLPLTEFTYAELESDKYSKLTACQYCNPPRRVAEIEKINQEHETSSPGMVEDYHNK